MNHDRAFAGVVLAAALLFILNPDFKSRTASAERIDGLPATAEPAGYVGSAENFVASQKQGANRAPASDGGNALGSGGVAPPPNARVLYENILIQIGPDDVGGCYANIVEAPVLAGTSITPPALDCRQPMKVRGSVIFEAAKSLLTDFEPNVATGDFPYDRRVIARWKNYGALCPAGDCSKSELVFLEDGAIRVRGTSAGPGTISASDLKVLLATYAAIAAAPHTERRIDDPKTSETVEIELIPAYSAHSFMRADFLQASLHYPNIPETKTACGILAAKTPTQFCALLPSELTPNVLPSPVATPPVIVRGPDGKPIPTPHLSATPSPTKTPGGNVGPAGPGGPGGPSGTGNPGAPTSSSSPKPGEGDPFAGTPTPDPPVKSNARMLTWGVMSSPSGIPAGFNYVSCHGTNPKCNAYSGDTACTSVLPMLCIRKDSSIQKPTFPDELNSIYTSWAAGEVKMIPNVPGTKLTSVAEADRICGNAFGNGWRMAEFHDGWGWGFTAKGNLEAGRQFWIWINDQPANCWNSAN